MFRKFTSRTFFVLPAILCLSLSISVLLSGCSKKKDEPEQPSGEPQPLTEAVIVLQTDSDEWQVQLFKEHLLYSEAVETNLPAPWSIPTRDEATILRTLTYGNGSERFVTSDGYTFGMPSASVTKAGAKTKYSVLGLWRRKTIIDVPF